MAYILTLIIGMICGAFILFILYDNKRRALSKETDDVLAQSVSNTNLRQELESRRQELLAQEREYQSRFQDFEQRAISYDELHNENTILKKDLRNIEINLRKTSLDHEKQQIRQDQLENRCSEVAARFLKDTITSMRSSLTPNNFVINKNRLQKVIEWCAEIGQEISPAEQEQLHEDLKQEFQRVVRAAAEKEEQARIKAQIREERALEKEIEKEMQRLERERTAIQAALEKALAEAQDEHSAEVESLKQRLAEAEERTQRAISQAQMTRSGHVYVISNIGSFGKDVYKVGLTRRLDPMLRVRELGDASVPFPFDVHMMISSDDAPSLENALHRALREHQMNKVNPRKEFFKSDLETIRALVEEHHGEVEYVADAEALEYYQSLEISPEDSEFIESVYAEQDESSAQSQGDPALPRTPQSN